eukprot:CAMPEP_0177192094 /NCGR_PEP_ID=MMETSP0367-20130122/21710_1 /TAXON_ID=447022 ORGANISM="Scrippsiella hangoei-like, Strain SHHI-4" /NCGR_SAMPLE_ID=MMETSP0367 /ASSEMBLY_ACC=CAM_ASM_000362 /LENGTH=80 /DNA_ID=CAMNT_0018639859 /DNA_START=25 /DNA_END=264 /DNA_ORIENTATION=+
MDPAASSATLALALRVEGAHLPSGSSTTEVNAGRSSHTTRADVSPLATRPLLALAEGEERARLPVHGHVGGDRMLGSGLG